jgi:hypothetical protein
MMDYFADVIDPNSGVVLASMGPLSYEQIRRDFAVPLFRGTRLGYRLTETADGHTTARIVELRLVSQ